MPPIGSQARREEILKLATTTGLASVEELSRHLGVTASTLRRGLARLTADGRLARAYGGAMAPNAHPGVPAPAHQGGTGLLPRRASAPTRSPLPPTPGTRP
ncbi:DeoR family transcriptional regulator [Streptomyces mutabilis]|uniref:HTH deoR-type domain-containing protein n=1 Tax=Streptomyces mutabilis TaxID=67332 RepID=A0A086MWB9_9ACTN|nr:DeoR family transcriptional regulator [Streptomyces mutabilis]KFG73187.1 hypothetical protein FM21_20375 [Streptomyces mutabilis]